MKKNSELKLSKRERQIMDVIYKKDKASAKEVLADLSDPPSYSAIRTLLKILVNKGFLKIKKEGLKYIYFPVVSKKSASIRAIKNLMTTYFNNSMEDAVAAIINSEKNKLSDNDYNRLLNLINKSKKDS